MSSYLYQRTKLKLFKGTTLGKGPFNIFHSSCGFKSQRPSMCIPLPNRYIRYLEYFFQKMRFSGVVRGKPGKRLIDHIRVGKYNPYSKDTTLPKTMFSDLYAQQCSVVAPLGPVLGARGITVMKFNEDFNNRTVQYK